MAPRSAAAAAVLAVLAVFVLAPAPAAAAPLQAPACPAGLTPEQCKICSLAASPAKCSACAAASKDAAKEPVNAALTCMVCGSLVAGEQQDTCTACVKAYGCVAGGQAAWGARQCRGAQAVQRVACDAAGRRLPGCMRRDPRN
jgi:hypothetical protein